MLRYFLIFFLFIATSIANAEIKDKIVQNLKDTENLDFKFEQNINENRNIKARLFYLHDLLYLRLHLLPSCQ